jgi:uncharacterized delta-60 repeat protein
MATGSVPPKARYPKNVNVPGLPNPAAGTGLTSLTYINGVADVESLAPSVVTYWTATGQGTAWFGKIQVPSSGIYHLAVPTVSATASLSINGQVLSASGADIYLDASSSYDIVVQALSSSASSSASLTWQVPGSASAVPVPTSALYPAVAGSGTGLLGTYYTQTSLAGTGSSQPASRVDFTSSLPSGTASAVWVGQVQPYTNGNYTFSFGGSVQPVGRVWVNNQLAYDSGAGTGSAGIDSISLSGGQKYDIRVEYLSGTLPRLVWASQRQPSEVIPASQLYPVQGMVVSASGQPSVDGDGYYHITLSATGSESSQIDHWLVDWGDGDKQVYPAGTTLADHLYPEGNASYRIVASAVLADGTSKSASPIMDVAFAATTQSVPVDPSWVTLSSKQDPTGRIAVAGLTSGLQVVSDPGVPVAPVDGSATVDDQEEEQERDVSQMTPSDQASFASFQAVAMDLPTTGDPVPVSDPIALTLDNVVVLRYTSAGVPDTTFGQGGKVTVLVNGTVDSVTFDDNLSFYILARNENGNGDLTLSHYLPNGALDTSFGTNGTFSMALSATDIANPWVMALRQSVGTSSNVETYLPTLGGSVTTAGVTSAEVVLLNANGDAPVTKPVPGPSGAPAKTVSAMAGAGTSVALVLGGTASNSTLAWLDTSGTLTYGTASGAAEAIATDSTSGTWRIVTAGVNSNGDIDIQRFSSSLAPDTSWGQDGVATAGTSGVSSVSSVAALGGGTIMASGTTEGSGSVGATSIVRLTDAGTPDANWGAAGVLISDFGSNESLAPAFDGSAVTASLQSGNIVLARYRSVDTITGSPVGTWTGATLVAASDDPASVVLTYNAPPGADLTLEMAGPGDWNYSEVPGFAPITSEGEHTYEVTGLTAGDHYDFRLRCSINGEVRYVTAFVDTPSAAPSLPTPTALGSGAIGSTGRVPVTVNWQAADGSGGPLTFTVRSYSSSNARPLFDGAGAPASSQVFTVDSPSATNEYTIYPLVTPYQDEMVVMVSNSSGSSAWMPIELTSVTLAPSEPAISMTVTPQSDGSTSVSFTGTSASVTVYGISATGQVSSLDTWAPGSVTNLGVVAPGIQSLVAFDGTNYSAVQSLQGVAGVASPSAPTNVTVTRLDGGKSLLTWDNASSQGTGFVVERLDTSAASPTWQQVGWISPNGDSMVDVTPTIFDVYQYRISAIGTDGTVATSDTVSTSSLRIQIVPYSYNMEDGETKQFTALIFDQNGQRVSGTVSWSIESNDTSWLDFPTPFTNSYSSTPPVLPNEPNQPNSYPADGGDGYGNIDSGGLYSAPQIGSGIVTVRASIGDVSGTAQINVREPSPNLWSWEQASSLASSAPGSGVSTLADSSNQGFVATQPLSSKEPTFQTNAMNGNPVVRFSGAYGQFLGISDLTQHVTDNFSISLVFRSTTGLGTDLNWRDGTGVFGAIGTVSGGDVGISLDAAGRILAGKGSTTLVSASGFNDGRAHVVTFIQTASAGTLTLYVDGVESASAADPSTDLEGLANPVIGARDAQHNYFTGDIAEVRVYSQPLSDADRSAMETELIEKYGADADPNAAPSFVTPATPSATTIAGTSVGLSALGQDDGGEGNLTYTWSVIGKPDGAADPAFDVNDTQEARFTTARFSQAGAYQFRLTISDAKGLTAVSQCSVNVTQVASGISIVPTTYTWTQYSGPSDATITSGNSKTLDVTLKGNGPYVFLCTLDIGGQVAIYKTAAVSPGAGTTPISDTFTVDDSQLVIDPAVNVQSLSQATIYANPTPSITWSVDPSDSDVGQVSMTFLPGAPNGGLAKSFNAEFSAPGTYLFDYTLSRGTYEASPATEGTVSVVVTQVDTLIRISLDPTTTPPWPLVNSTYQLQAVTYDQFGHALATGGGGYSWSLPAGNPMGTISGDLFTAGQSTGDATVTVTAGGLSSTVDVSVDALTHESPGFVGPQGYDFGFESTNLSSSDQGTSLLVDSSTGADNIYIGGSTTMPDGSSAFMLEKYDDKGVLDTQFGSVVGAAAPPVPGAVHEVFAGTDATNAKILSITEQGSGASAKILALGTITDPSGNQRLALARYNPDGTFDTTFGNGTDPNADYSNWTGDGSGVVWTGGALTNPRAGSPGDLKNINVVDPPAATGLSERIVVSAGGETVSGGHYMFLDWFGANDPPQKR